MSKFLLLDTGSDKSYCTSALIKQLRPQQLGFTNISINSFGKPDLTPERLPIYSLQICTLEGKYICINVIEVAQICNPVKLTKIPSQILDKFNSLQLNCVSVTEHQVEVSILLGMDSYWRIVNDQILPIRNGNLVAISTSIGWILSGSFPSLQAAHKGNDISLVNITHTEDQFQEFWSLETIGIQEDRGKDLKDNSIFRDFIDTLEYSPLIRAYKVRLPWRSSTSKSLLGDNFGCALKRLISLHDRTFRKNPQLEGPYYEVFQKYFKLGFIERVPPDETNPPFPTYYMPHRAVLKENSSSPIRPVFDASCKSQTGKSLNDTLLVGPNLLPDLVAVLLRFRRWPIAISGDIRMAFLNLFVHEEDKDYHRFLLYLNHNIVIFRFNRLPFGNASSPFLLNATIKYHINLFPQSRAKQELNSNIYVDNLMSGADSIEEAEALYSETCTMLSSANFQLDKWSTNGGKLHKLFLKDNVNNVSSKYLGVEWDSHNDIIRFSLNLPTYNNMTKRSLLSIISSIYDPMGLISPYTLMGKIIFQKVWSLGPQQSWDAPLPVDLTDMFHNWLTTSQELKQFITNRCYFPQKWSQSERNLEVIAFGDACPNGYGAVVYLRTRATNGKYLVSFCNAKTRVAPVKVISLPRLELLGALLAARLADFVKRSLQIQEAVTTCYTDSSIVLHWILKGDHSNFKSFVMNRILEIKQKVPPEQWYHCPGVLNPADITSRGALGHDLVNNTMWLEGPPWLKIFKICPQTTSVPPPMGVDTEIKNTTVCLNLSENIDTIFDFKDSNSLSFIVHTISYIRRFLKNTRVSKDQRQVGPISATEAVEAQETLWRLQQRRYWPTEVDKLKKGENIPKSSNIYTLNPYLDPSGLLRIGGRLHNADLTFTRKHPIILPASKISLLLIKFLHVLYSHSGVDATMAITRENYWVIRGRHAAKTVIKFCIVCQRQHARTQNEIAPPLPDFRVRFYKPFQTIGLDFAGPLKVKFSKKKGYVLLFVCSMTRAVHLELTSSLNTTDTLFSFRKFCGRRGVPHNVVSDNAATFKEVSQKMFSIYGPNSPKWTFSTPRSPWRTGFIERIVRSMKEGMKKSVGLGKLTKSELEADLCSVEYSINSRPMTKAQDSVPLRPLDLLIPFGQMAQDPSEQTLKDYQMSVQQNVSELAAQWQNQYISNLPMLVSKHFNKKGSLGVGDVVLLNDNDNAIKNSRLLWPLGRIVELIPGRDEKIRSVVLKTAKTTLTRPIQRLVKLELSPHNWDETLETLSGRKVKPCN